jgi:signal transduction histidine kinase
VLVWIGHRSTAEWQRSNEQVVERRASELLALVSGALNRDMKGAHASILASIHLPQVLTDARYDLADAFAGAFARFPYPESFFVWKARTRPTTVTFFNRADRRPRWSRATPPPVAYPVLIVEEPLGVHGLIDGVRHAAQPRAPLVIQHAAIGGTPYQVVAQAFYTGVDGDDLAGILGYTVNLDWVHEHYFGPLISQLPGIGGDTSDLSVSILDGQGNPVIVPGARAASAVTMERQFPLAFFDAALVPGPNRPRDGEPWTIRIGASVGADHGTDTTRRMLIVTTLSGAAAMVAIFLTIRAVRATADLAALKSEFVSTVTHELKTPVAGIALVAETLAMGRGAQPDTIREYGTLLWIETRRLTRLIENLLAYARLSDVQQAYAFEALDPGELVDEALHQCRLRIAALGFQVDNAVPSDLPRVWGDGPALVQVLENVLDNALKYSGDSRDIRISGEANAREIHLTVQDMGPGIPSDELHRVFDKFFRGRHAPSGGSGLGLTISRRIVSDHGGTLEIVSAPGRGTTVRVVLPARPT